MEQNYIFERDHWIHTALNEELKLNNTVLFYFFGQYGSYIPNVQESTTLTDYSSPRAV